jgi:hypothetical protein
MVVNIRRTPSERPAAARDASAGKIAAEQPGQAAVIMAGTGRLRDEYARAYAQDEQEISR